MEDFTRDFIHRPTTDPTTASPTLGRPITDLIRTMTVMTLVLIEEIPVLTINLDLIQTTINIIMTPDQRTAVDPVTGVLFRDQTKSPATPRWRTRSQYGPRQ